MKTCPVTFDIFKPGKSIFYWAFLCFLFFSVYSIGANDKETGNRLFHSLNAVDPGFEENKGQFIGADGKPSESILFQTMSNGTYIYVTTGGISYFFTKVGKGADEKEQEDEKIDGAEHEEKEKEIEWCRTDMQLTGAHIGKDNLIAENPIAENVYNYYLAHCPEGVTDVSRYQKITFTNIYAGIDWVLYISKNGFKYDFIVNPGASTNDIQMRYSDYLPTLQADEKSLLIKTPLGDLKEGELLCYQDNEQDIIASSFVVDEQHVKIKVAEYDHSKPLIIDPPVLTWSTYYGGAFADGPLGICTDKQGNLFITGYTYSVIGPLLNAGPGTYYQPTNIGTFIGKQTTDIFIAKFNSSGELQWATYYGGTSKETANDITVDKTGNVYITGNTFSTDFPKRIWPGAYNKAVLEGPSDACILKFTNNGARIWATYFGGTALESGNAVEIDPMGNIFIGGDTYSTDLTIINLAGSYNQPTLGGGFGRDIFLARFSPAGVLQWSTYYGGAKIDKVRDILSDNCGNIYVTGFTESTDFPVKNRPGAFNQGTLAPSTAAFKFDGFIVRFSTTGAWEWSTYIGGNQSESLTEMATDIQGNVYIIGGGESPDFPIQNLVNAYNQPLYGGGDNDGILLKFDKGGAMLWSTYFGGSGADYLSGITINELGELYISGMTRSTDFPVQQAAGGYYDNTFAGDRDIIAAKFLENGALNWSAYFGGNGDEWSTGITYAYNGEIYITGEFVDISGAPTRDPGSNAFFQSAPIGSPIVKHSGCIINFEDPVVLPFIDFTATPVCDDVAMPFQYAGTVNSNKIEEWEWNFGDPASGASNSASIQNPSHVFSGPGIYSVTLVTHYYCLSDTVHKNVTVYPLPAPNAGPAQTICPGSSAQLTSSSAVNYSWSPAISLSNSTIYNPVASPTATTNYTLTVTDQNGCTAADEVVITINQPPNIIVQPSSSYCGLAIGSATVTVNTGTGPFTYLWSGPGSTTSSVSNLPAGTYSVTVTDVIGCTAAGSATVASLAGFTVSINNFTNVSCNGLNDGVAMASAVGAVSNYTYLWNNAQTAATATGLPTGTHSVTVVDNVGCSSGATVTITEPALLTTTISTNDPLCFNGLTGYAGASLNGGTSPYLYSWSNGQSTSNATGLAAGTYTLTVTDNNGCTSEQNATINNPVQLIVTIPPIAAVCAGQQASISTTLSGGASSFNYLWSDGSTTSSINPTLATITSFSVIVTDVNGCTAQAEANAPINPLPEISFTSNKTYGCGPLCTDFLNTTPNASTQQWTFGDNNGSSLPNPDHCYTTPGNYHVMLTVTDNNGCSNILTQNNYITVHPNPIASFIATPQTTTLLQPTVNFTDQSQGAASWAWSFSDVSNSFSSTQNTSYTYQDTGSYRVRLVVTNEFGCTDTSYESIEIKADFVLYIPNTFTPNNDGVNDVFMPYGTNIDASQYLFQIFDRWGNLIFSTTNLSQGWDGTCLQSWSLRSGRQGADNGKHMAQIDTYVWQINLTDTQGQKHQYAGHVNLLR